MVPETSCKQTCCFFPLSKLKVSCLGQGLLSLARKKCATQNQNLNELTYQSRQKGSSTEYRSERYKSNNTRGTKPGIKHARISTGTTLLFVDTKTTIKQFHCPHKQNEQRLTHSSTGTYTTMCIAYLYHRHKLARKHQSTSSPRLFIFSLGSL